MCSRAMTEAFLLVSPMSNSDSLKESSPSISESCWSIRSSIFSRSIRSWWACLSSISFLDSNTLSNRSTKNFSTSSKQNQDSWGSSSLHGSSHFSAVRNTRRLQSTMLLFSMNSVTLKEVVEYRFFLESQRWKELSSPFSLIASRSQIQNLPFEAVMLLMVPSTLSDREIQLIFCSSIWMPPSSDTISLRIYSLNSSILDIFTSLLYNILSRDSIFSISDAFSTRISENFASNPPPNCPVSNLNPPLFPLLCIARLSILNFSISLPCSAYLPSNCPMNQLSLRLLASNPLIFCSRQLSDFFLLSISLLRRSSLLESIKGRSLISLIFRDMEEFQTVSFRMDQLRLEISRRWESVSLRDLYSASQYCCLYLLSRQFKWWLSDWYLFSQALRSRYRWRRVLTQLESFLFQDQRMDFSRVRDQREGELRGEWVEIIWGDWQLLCWALSLFIQLVFFASMSLITPLSVLISFQSSWIFIEELSLLITT